MGSSCLGSMGIYWDLFRINSDVDLLSSMLSHTTPSPLMFVVAVRWYYYNYDIRIYIYIYIYIARERERERERERNIVGYKDGRGVSLPQGGRHEP